MKNSFSSPNEKWTKPWNCVGGLWQKSNDFVMTMASDTAEPNLQVIIPFVSFNPRTKTLVPPYVDPIEGLISKESRPETRSKSTAFEPT